MSIPTDINAETFRKVQLATPPSQKNAVEWQSRQVEELSSDNRCYFIPPHMQEHICSHCDHMPEYQAEIYARHYRRSESIRKRRTESVVQTWEDASQEQLFGFGTKKQYDGDTIQKIYDARNLRGNLPGRLVKDMNDPDLQVSRDLSVNRAFDSTKKTYDFYSKVFARSISQGTQLISTVHYGRNYSNAFWTGKQMVYGDGDDHFADFTKDLDVTAHEITHLLTQSTLNLVYRDQSGALSEHISDAFGVMVAQYSFNQTIKEASWRIGEEVLMGTGAVRSVRYPGSAYHTEFLGRDPQPRKLSDYSYMTQDNGGVHVNSGILNRAFYLFCRALGGYSWEKAGKVWYQTLFDPQLSSNASFEDFAKATIRSVEKLSKGNKDWSGKEVDALRAAWKRVEVLL